jgi:hypothetical protein
MEKYIKHITLQATINLVLKLIKKLLYWLVVFIEYLVNCMGILVQHINRWLAPKLAVIQQLLEKRAIEFLEH